MKSHRWPTPTQGDVMTDTPFNDKEEQFERLWDESPKGVNEVRH